MNRQDTMGIEELLLTLAKQEGIKKGNKEGRRQGIKEGRLEREAFFVRNLLTNTSFSDADIARLVEVKVRFVSRLRGEMQRCANAPHTDIANDDTISISLTSTFVQSNKPPMTPQKRLDQIEPLFAEMLAKQDETSAKVERVSAQVRQLTVTFVQVTTAQSDNIQFLLGKVQGLEQGQRTLEQGQQDLQSEMKQGFEQVRSEMKQDLEQVKEGLRAEMQQGFEQVNQRVEQVQQGLRAEMQQGFAQIVALIEKKL